MVNDLDDSWGDHSLYFQTPSSANFVTSESHMEQGERWQQVVVLQPSPAVASMEQLATTDNLMNY